MQSFGVERGAERSERTKRDDKSLGLVDWLIWLNG